MKKQLKDLSHSQLQGIVIDLLRNIDEASSILEASAIFNENGYPVDDLKKEKIDLALDKLAFGSENADNSGWESGVEYELYMRYNK